MKMSCRRGRGLCCCHKTGRGLYDYVITRGWGLCGDYGDDVIVRGIQLLVGKSEYMNIVNTINCSKPNANVLKMFFLNYLCG